MATSIAKLGIVVEAEGVQNAQAQLQHLSDTGQLTTQKLVYLANAGGEVSKSMTRVDTSVKTVVRSGFSAVAIIGEFGPVGRIAAQALTAMAVAAGPVAIAFGAVAGAIAFVSYRINAVRENFRNLAEREMKDLAREAQSLKTTLETKGAIKILESADPEMAKLTQSYQNIRIAQEKLGASTQQLALIDRKYAIESARLIEERARGLKEQIALLEAAGDPLAQNAIRMESAMQGMDSQTKKLSLSLLRLQDLASLKGIGTSELQRAMTELGITANLLQPPFASLLVVAGHLKMAWDAGTISAKQYNEELRKIAMSTASAEEKPFIEQLGNIRNRLREMSAIMGGTTPFDISIQKAWGLTDPFDALVKDTREIERNMRAVLGMDISANLRNALNQIISDIKMIKEEKIEIGADGTPAIEEAKRVNEAIQSIPDKTVTIRTATAMGGGVGSMAGSQPDWWINAFNRVQAQGGMTFRINAQGSPTMPFSEYFENYAPGLIRKLGKGASLTVDSNIIALILPLLSQLTALQRAGGAIMGPRLGLSLGADFGPSWTAWERGLKNEIGFILALAATSGGSQGVNRDMGTGKGPCVCIDLRGASLSQEFLDDRMIPALERALIRTTGESPEFRVLN